MQLPALGADLRVAVHLLELLAELLLGHHQFAFVVPILIAVVEDRERHQGQREIQPQLDQRPPHRPQQGGRVLLRQREIFVLMGRQIEVCHSGDQQNLGDAAAEFDQRRQ